MADAIVTSPTVKQSIPPSFGSGTETLRTGLTILNELELKARTPPGGLGVEKFAQLQHLPDTILAISTPSS